MLSKNIPLNKYFSFISEFKFGPDELWGLLDYEKVGLIKNNSIIIPIEKYIMINLDTKFNYPEKINDMFLATKEQREFFNNKIILKEDCEYILKILSDMEEKEKAFTEGVENTAIEEPKTEEFNPLKMM